MRMSAVTKVPAKLLSKTGLAGLAIRQKSPEILLGAGILGVVAGTVLVAKQTMKLESEIEIHKDRVNQVKERDLDENEEKKALAGVYLRTGGRMAKLYASAAASTTAGVLCIVASHNIQSSRIAGLSAAYTGLHAAYDAYRGRVREEVGDEKELELHRGVIKIEDEEISYTKTGKEKRTKSVHDYLQPGQVSLFTFCFDEKSSEFLRDRLYNKDFLLHKQAMWNEIYNLRKYVFLNDVLEDLGFDTTDLGYTRTVGWMKGLGDDYIDFGIFEIGNAAKRDFANGYEPAIWLDFNVDGEIITKVGVGLPAGILDPELEYELHMNEIVDEMAEKEEEKELNGNA